MLLFCLFTEKLPPEISKIEKKIQFERQGVNSWLISSLQTKIVGYHQQKILMVSVNHNCSFVLLIMHFAHGSPLNLRFGVAAL